ncbi:MAG: type II toxin-antitoxin system PemK/MazF family toxin [Thermomicrobiales bacterium]
MERETEPRAGEIWIVDFDPQAGREQAGRRPALIVSNDHYNMARNNLFIVCPLTTRDRGLPYHVPVGPIPGVLPRPSLVMCEQVCAQDRSRFVERWGPAPMEARRTVREIVGSFLDDLRGGGGSGGGE